MIIDEIREDLILPEHKEDTIRSFLSFKQKLDRKIEMVHKKPQKNSEHFINIYKTNDNFDPIQPSSANLKQSILASLKTSDFLANSEMLLSNMDDIINKDIITEKPSIVKVPTSDSLSENEKETTPVEHDQINNKIPSPNNTGLSFYNRNERLNSIDEKDESKEEDNLSKESKEVFQTEEYHIISKEEFEKKQGNMKKLISQKQTQKETLPKFIFLDYKEFKSNSVQNKQAKSVEKKLPEEFNYEKMEYSYSMSSLPNYSTLMKKKYLFVYLPEFEV